MDWYLYSPEYPEAPLEYVIRDVWGARPARSVRPLKYRIKYVFITYNTGVDYCRYPQECIEAMRQLQNRAMDEKGLPDIKYNFLIGGDGYVYEGRGWVAKPPKSKKFPQKGRRINIGYIGERKAYLMKYDIIKLGLDIIYYGVENKLLKRKYEVTELKEEGRVLPPVPNYNTLENLPHTMPWTTHDWEE